VRRYRGWTAAIAAAALAGALAPGANGDIYKFVDRHGVIHLSDRPLGPGYVAVVRTWKGWVERGGGEAAALERNRRRFAPIIDAIAHQHRLDRALVHAVVTAESAYNPVAVSRAGAVGLMQLMPGTAARYGVHDRRDPRQNVYGGVRYLRDLLLQFDDLTLALAAYNAGENAVVRYGNQIPPYDETRTYVRRVLNYYRRYRGAS
jgi:soluble lytic murein transglycosylase-like protein